MSGCHGRQRRYRSTLLSVLGNTTPRHSSAVERRGVGKLEVGSGAPGCSTGESSAGSTRLLRGAVFVCWMLCYVVVGCGCRTRLVRWETPGTHNRQLEMVRKPDKVAPGARRESTQRERISSSDRCELTDEPVVRKTLEVGSRAHSRENILAGANLRVRSRLLRGCCVVVWVCWRSRWVVEKVVCG